MSPTYQWSMLYLLAFAVAQLGATAEAQEYPSRPVTIVLVLAAGTGLDVVARTYGEQLAQSLGRPVVFDNRPGANGIVAINALKNLPADGHALLVATSAALALNRTTFKQLPYDAAKDFVPVSMYLKSPFILIVHPSLPVRSVPELIKLREGAAGTVEPTARRAPAACRAWPPRCSRRAFGLEHHPRAVQEQPAIHRGRRRRARAARVRGSRARRSALIQDQRLRALAVSSLTRLSTLPDVPTMAEATGRPGFEAVSWHALVAPAATPRPIVNRLHGEMTRIMKLPEVRERIVNIGLIPVEPQSIEENQRYIVAEAKKWGDLITKLGLGRVAVDRASGIIPEDNCNLRCSRDPK